MVSSLIYKQKGCHCFSADSEALGHIPMLSTRCAFVVPWMYIRVPVPQGTQVISVSRDPCSPGNGPIIFFISNTRISHRPKCLTYLSLSSFNPSKSLPGELSALSHVVMTPMAFRGWGRVDGEVALALFFPVHSPHPSVHLSVDITRRAVQWTSLTFRWTPDKQWYREHLWLFDLMTPGKIQSCFLIFKLIHRDVSLCDHECSKCAFLWHRSPSWINLQASPGEMEWGAGTTLIWQKQVQSPGLRDDRIDGTHESRSGRIYLLPASSGLSILSHMSNSSMT